jgi:hypothetical protein
MNKQIKPFVAIIFTLLMLAVPSMAACHSYSIYGDNATNCGSTFSGSNSTICDNSNSTPSGKVYTIYGTYENGNAQMKVCNNAGECKSDSFTLADNDNSISSWLAKLFGDDSASTCSTSQNSVSTAAPSNTDVKSTNYYGNLALDTESTGKTCNAATVQENSSNSDSYDGLYAALRADKTEECQLTADYTSKNFAEDLCAAMEKQGFNCKIIKVTFTDGKVNYLNSFKTNTGDLLVDSCGTAEGTGIKKQVTVLEVGKQWTAKSLFGECGKTYNRGVVKSID